MHFSIFWLMPVGWCLVSPPLQIAEDWHSEIQRLETNTCLLTLQHPNNSAPWFLPGDNFCKTPCINAMFLRCVESFEVLMLRTVDCCQISKLSIIVNQHSDLAFNLKILQLEIDKTPSCWCSKLLLQFRRIGKPYYVLITYS